MASTPHEIRVNVKREVDPIDFPILTEIRDLLVSINEKVDRRPVAIVTTKSHLTMAEADELSKMIDDAMRRG